MDDESAEIFGGESFTKVIIKSFAQSSATTIGFLTGLVIVGKVMESYGRRKNSQEPNKSTK